MPVEKLATGRVGAPFGIKGFLSINSYSGETDHLLKLQQVELREWRGANKRIFPVVKTRRIGNRVVMQFKGIDDREKAKGWTGWELWVFRGEASILMPGEFYTADLCGCEVFYKTSVIGKVTSVIEAGGGDCLEVTNEIRQRFIVPFLEIFVPFVDLTAKRIELSSKFELP